MSDDLTALRAEVAALEEKVNLLERLERAQRKLARRESGKNGDATIEESFHRIFPEMNLSVLRRANREPRMIAMRTEVIQVLRAEGYSATAIGDLLDRTHGAVLHLLKKEAA